MNSVVNVGGIEVGAGRSLALMAGPCVIESRGSCLALANRLAELAQEEGIPLIFKASYDKANRTSVRSFRGPGLVEGLDILAEVKAETGLPVLTDVHRAEDAAAVAAVADVIQIPAFLARQTDLVLAVGAAGKPVNVKKAQFMAPSDVRHVVEKIESTGNDQVLVTERGTCFGYNDLVADMRSLLMLAELGGPVVFDATHSVQRPSGAGAQSGGDAKWAPCLARAAVATGGCRAVFLEMHEEPARAKSDSATSLRVEALRKLWRELKGIDEIIQ